MQGQYYYTCIQRSIMHSPFIGHVPRSEFLTFSVRYLSITISSACDDPCSMFHFLGMPPATLSPSFGMR